MQIWNWTEHGYLQDDLWIFFLSSFYFSRWIFNIEGEDKKSLHRQCIFRGFPTSGNPKFLTTWRICRSPQRAYDGVRGGKINWSVAGLQIATSVKLISKTLLSLVSNRVIVLAV
jgi:hypothetical protein